MERMLPCVGRVVHRNDFFLKNGGSLEAGQLRLLLYVISQLPAMDLRRASDLPAIEMSDVMVARVLQLEGPRRGWITYLGQAMKTLASVPASVVDASGGRLYTTWFDFIYHDEKNKRFTFQLNPILGGFFLRLSKQFTVYELGYIFTLTRPWSVRLYDVLKGSAYRGFFEISPNDFRYALGLVNFDKVGAVESFRISSFSSLNKTVIGPSVEEINEKTDLNVQYDLVRSSTGHKAVEKIVFTLSLKDAPPLSFPGLDGLKNGGKLVSVDRDEIISNISAKARREERAAEGQTSLFQTS